MRDVTDRFHVTDIDSTELSRHLMGAFNHAAFAALDRIDIPDAEAPIVQIYYSPAGAITKIVTRLPDEELRPYIDDLEKLFLSPTHEQVQRFIGFANAPVNGTWECEAFTITAAPPEAPRPQQYLADHPYILEVPFDATDDMLFNINRAYRLRARYELLLSLFAPGIKATSNQHHVIWGIDAKFAPGRDLTPRLVQEHYTIPGFPSVVDSRTPVTDPLIELIPDTDYFGLHGRTVGQDLVLPQSLEAWINSALACDDPVSKRLVRAAYWLNHASQVFRLSLSASLVAAIQAIEVLLPAVKGEVCPTCKREVAPGPTRKFKDFLQQYAPTNDSEERKARDLLYRQRSRLIHGHELLGTDGDYNFGWTNPAHAFDRMTLDGAVRLARIATINWFVAHASSTIRSTGA